MTIYIIIIEKMWNWGDFKKHYLWTKISKLYLPKRKFQNHKLKLVNSLCITTPMPLSASCWCLFLWHRCLASPKEFTTKSSGIYSSYRAVNLHDINIGFFFFDNSKGRFDSPHGRGAMFDFTIKSLCCRVE